MLENYYFNEKDYEIFNEENVSSIRPEILEQRKIVQQKLYDINDNIKDELVKKNLHNHWRNENITSLIYPCVFNLGRVNWLGIRYGRSKSMNFEIVGIQQKRGEYAQCRQRGWKQHA